MKIYNCLLTVEQNHKFPLGNLLRSYVLLHLAYSVGLFLLNILKISISFFILTLSIKSRYQCSLY